MDRAVDSLVACGIAAKQTNGPFLTPPLSNLSVAAAAVCDCFWMSMDALAINYKEFTVHVLFYAGIVNIWQRRKRMDDKQKELRHAEFARKSSQPLDQLWATNG